MSKSPTSPLPLLADASIGAKPLVFLRAREVCSRLGVKKTLFYELQKGGEFPLPAKLGKASVWPEHEVEAYMAERMADRYRIEKAA